MVTDFGINKHVMLITEILNELSLPPTRQDAGKLLRNAGYVPIGKGEFGSIYARPNDQFVLKLFTSKDEAYIQFLRLIQSVSNPHFPVIHGKPMRITDTYYAVRLERLQPVNANFRNLVMACSDYLGALSIIRDLEPKQRFINPHGWKKEKEMYERPINALLYSQPSLAEALDLIDQYLIKGNPNIMNDIHLGNMAMRGNIPVFIDPVMIGGALKNYRLAAERGTVLRGMNSIKETEEIEPTEEEIRAIQQDKKVKNKPDGKNIRYNQPGTPPFYPFQ